MSIRLMIADDHALMRAGLKKLFTMADDLEVVAEASNGDEVLELLSSVSIDVLTLDVTMPKTSGVNLIKKILSIYPTLPILILTMHDEPQIARNKLDAGALGYITKSSNPEMLIEAVRKVASGGRYISQELAEQMLFNENKQKSEAPHDCLSDRELQVFIKLAQGLGANDIATELFVSYKTISSHKTHLMKKMKFENNLQLMQYAIAHGLVAPNNGDET